MYFSQLLPVLAMSTPLIGKFWSSYWWISRNNPFFSSTVRFYSYTLYLISISFVISVVVINFSRNKKQYGVNKLVKDNIINGKIGAIFGSSLNFVGQQTVEAKLEEEDGQASNELHIFTEDKKLLNDPQNDWILLSVIIDRIAFVIYLIIFIIFGLCHYF